MAACCAGAPKVVLPKEELINKTPYERIPAAFQAMLRAGVQRHLGVRGHAVSATESFRADR